MEEHDLLGLHEGRAHPESAEGGTRHDDALELSTGEHPPGRHRLVGSARACGGGVLAPPERGDDAGRRAHDSLTYAVAPFRVQARKAQPGTG